MDFPITPSPPSTIIFASVIALLTIGIGAVFVWFAITAPNLTTAIEDQALVIDVPFYGRSVSLSALDVSSAKVVDLTGDSDLRPRTRTNGIGLPGYAVGWFRLHNGDKALAALTSRETVVYLRTTEGYALLLSLTDPERFLAELRVRKERADNGG